MQQRRWIMMMTALLFCLFATVAIAAEPAVLKAATLKSWLNEKKPVILADIQKPNHFKKHHFYGAVETNAYPVKSDKDREKLGVVVRMFKKTGNVVVVLGPRGSSASKRAAAYLLEQGIPADKLFYLEGGIKGWPDQEMLLDVAGGCG